jgi:hypothetical protein
MPTPYWKHGVKCRAGTGAGAGTGDWSAHKELNPVNSSIIIISVQW